MKWYMARCEKCAHTLAFANEAERKEWLIAHHDADEKHVVKTYEEE